MMVRRTLAALLAPFVLLAGGEAEGQSGTDTKKPALRMNLDTVPDRRAEADLAVRGLSEQDFDTRSNGMVRSWDLNGKAVIGVGRFTVPEMPVLVPTWKTTNIRPASAMGTAVSRRSASSCRSNLYALFVARTPGPRHLFADQQSRRS